MSGSGEEERETIRPQFDSAIVMDFQGAKITSDTGLLLPREIDERFGILGPMASGLEDSRSWVHSKHSLLQMVRQRVHQIAAGYEDCNDADFLRIDPALRLAIGKGDAAFAQPEVYEYCEGERVTYFIRLPANAVLNRLMDPYLKRPVGRPPKRGGQIRLVDLRYRAQTWDRERRVVAKIERYDGELFPRIGFIVTNSKLPAGKVVKVYNRRCDVENRIKEGKNTLRWDKTHLPSLRRQPSSFAHGCLGV